MIHYKLRAYMTERSIGYRFFVVTFIPVLMGVSKERVGTKKMKPVNLDVIWKSLNLLCIECFKDFLKSTM